LVIIALQVFFATLLGKDLCSMMALAGRMW